MSDAIDSKDIDIPCRTCGGKTKKSIGWINTHKKLVCSCGQTIAIDAEQLAGEIARVKKSIADFEKSLKNFGKR